MEQSQIRNFCIIAHVDHGKSTLADRFLEITNSVPSRSMMNQYLDQMDLERERGITIKAQAVRLNYDSVDKKPYQLNIIDTPGHVDFSNEVFRSLRACDGALLLVDASQGIQAQTLANFYSALEADLTIIPVINKIDLPSARIDEVSEEIQQTFGFKSNEIQLVSAKTGEGVKELLDAVVELIAAAAEVPWLVFQYPQEPSLLQTHGHNETPPAVFDVYTVQSAGKPPPKSSSQIGGAVLKDFTFDSK